MRIYILCHMEGTSGIWRPEVTRVDARTVRRIVASAAEACGF